MRSKFKIASIMFTTIALVVNFSASAQLANIKNRFEQYFGQNLVEKVYVQTDKNFYLTGEILWFKLYTVNGSTNKPVNLSKVAYVDVLDAGNVTVMQAKIALKKGLGSGSVYIPVTLANGNYKLRAYTNLMKNYDAAVYFEKPISIINPLRQPDVQAAINKPDVDIQFFPEGGNLLNGVLNKVAVKITGVNGEGENLNGVVLNSHNDTIGSIKPQMFGLSTFLITPAENNVYRAVFNRDKKIITRQLPPAVNQGYNMLLSALSGNELQITVNSSQKTGRVVLVSHNSQTVNVAQSAALNNGTIVFRVDKSRLAAGINHFTVFDSENRPVSERLYFIRPNKKLTIKAVTNNIYNTRSKVGISLTTTGFDGKAVAANLSMSVYRIDSLQQRNQADITSYLWLTSELKGNIESPGYYFDNLNTATENALDNLMLTQGWSRFSWKDVLNANKPALKFLPEYNGHIISAKITEPSGKPMPAVIAYLGIPGRRVQMYTSLSDSAGQLVFNTKEMYGPGEIVIQAKTDSTKNYTIDVNNPFSGQFSSTVYPVLKLTSLPLSLLENYSLSMQVQNLYASANTRQYYEPGIDSSAFYFKPYKTYKLDDYTRFTTMEEIFKEFIAEGSVFKSKNRFHIRTLGEQGPVGEDPLVLIDGVPFFNTDKIIAADPLKMQRLEVVRNRYYYGPTENEGIFSFLTYKGDLGGVELDPRSVVLDYEGMQLQRKFYSPVYDSEAQLKSRLPDLRNVLSWVPEANTNADGKNQFSFYTSDQAGKYIAVIEGMANNGDAGSGYVIFEVRK